MSDPDRKRVAVLAVATGKISYFGSVGHDPGQFSEPTGIAVGPDGRVYVLDRDNNNVQIFDPNKQP
jgi:DNA-binding beta-propeller fold protein YncE